MFACQRSGPQAEERAKMVRGAHPWNRPGAEVEPQGREPDPNAESAGTQVATPADRGPALPQQDTLDVALLPGRYLQVCVVTEEKFYLIPPSEQDLLELGANSYAKQTVVEAFATHTVEGNWRKDRAGVLQMGFGSSSELQDTYGQLFDQDFLYLWNYELRLGIWYARIPAEANQRMEANRFVTDRGTLRITRFVGGSFEGVVEGTQPQKVNGYYSQGILSLRWAAETGAGSGYAAFICAPDWSSIRGTWWIEDWEAAPFGGGWTGSSDMPDARASSAGAN
jgi:hypothetical protein